MSVVGGGEEGSAGRGISRGELRDACLLEKEGILGGVGKRLQCL